MHNFVQKTNEGFVDRIFPEFEKGNSQLIVGGVYTPPGNLSQEEHKEFWQRYGDSGGKYAKPKEEKK